MLNVKKMSLFFSLLVFASHGLFAPNNRHGRSQPNALDRQRRERAEGYRPTAVAIAPGAVRWIKFDGAIDESRFPDNCRKIICGDRDRKIITTDVETLEWRAALDRFDPWSRDYDYYPFVTISPDKTKIAIVSYEDAGTMLQLYSLTSGELLHYFLLAATEGYATSYDCATFSHDGRFIAAPLCCYECVGIWEVESGRFVRRLGQRHVGLGIKARAYVHDAVRQWFDHDYREERIQRPVAGWRHNSVSALAFSPDGQTLAVYHGDRNSIQFWNLLAGELLQELVFKFDGTHVLGIQNPSVVFSRDGRYINLSQMYFGEYFIPQATVPYRHAPAFAPMLSGRVQIEAEEREAFNALIQANQLESQAIILRRLLRRFSADYHSKDGAVCNICHERDFTLTDPRLAVLPCTHYYHAECLDGWLERSLTCPTCRAPDINYTRLYAE